MEKLIAREFNKLESESSGLAYGTHPIIIVNLRRKQNENFNASWLFSIDQKPSA